MSLHNSGNPPEIEHDAQSSRRYKRRLDYLWPRIKALEIEVSSLRQVRDAVLDCEGVEMRNCYEVPKDSWEAAMSFATNSAKVRLTEGLGPAAPEREALAACPFCGERPRMTLRPDDAEETTYFAAVACYCGGYSACAHKRASAPTADEAEAKVRAAWNCRAQSQIDTSTGVHSNQEENGVYRFIFP